MSRKALSYEQNLEKRGIEAAKDRLEKNQAKLDDQIAKLQSKIAEAEAAKVQDAEAFKAAVMSYQESLKAEAEATVAVDVEVAETNLDEVL